MNQIINMIIRQFMNQLINRGMRAGFDQAGKAMDRRKVAKGEPVVDPADMTPQERRQQRAARQQARQARQQLQATRRINKF